MISVYISIYLYVCVLCVECVVFIIVAKIHILHNNFSFCVKSLRFDNLIAFLMITFICCDIAIDFEFNDIKSEIPPSHVEK